MRSEIDKCLKDKLSPANSFTIHAAYSIGEGKHITVFYNDRCDLQTLGYLIDHLKYLPSDRLVEYYELIELHNPKNHEDPFIAAKIKILDPNHNQDIALMERISNFSDKYSWRQYLQDEGKEQYSFTFHTTLGLKSEWSDEKINKLPRFSKTKEKYFKIHQNGHKVYI